MGNSWHKASFRVKSRDVFDQAKSCQFFVTYSRCQLAGDAFDPQYCTKHHVNTKALDFVPIIHSMTCDLQPKVSSCSLFADHGSVISQGATCAFPSVQLAPCTWFPPCRANRTPFASDDCSTPTNTTGSQVCGTHSTTMHEYYCKCISQLKVTSVIRCGWPSWIDCIYWTKNEQ